MKYLKKQPVALFIALLVVLGSAFYGANRSLGERVARAEEQFYIGVFDEDAGFVRASIESQLTHRATTALRMLSVGEFSHGDADLDEAEASLRQARTALLDGLAGGLGPRALYEADQALTIAAERYYALLHPLVVAVQGEDLEALETANTTMQSAARVIAESGYNEAIRTFNRTVLERFPTSFLLEITFVQPPELFA